MGDYASDKKCTRIFTFKFVRSRDKDIIARLESMPNKQQYVKRLIRADIAKNCPDIDTYIDADEGINPEE